VPLLRSVKAPLKKVRIPFLGARTANISVCVNKDLDDDKRVQVFSLLSLRCQAALCGQQAYW